VDIFPQDSTSEWRMWNAEAEQISALEATEKRLNILKKTQIALVKARLYGGSLIIIGIKGDTDLSKPLDFNKVKQGGIEYLNVVSRYEISAGQLDWDIASPYYGTPSYYTYSTPNGTSVTIHPSRTVRFVGRELPSHQAVGYDGWGDSIIQRIDDSIKNAAIPQQQIATLLMESNVDVIKIPGLMANVSTKEYRDKIITRWQLAALAKSVNRAMIMDKEEEWDKLSPNFGGLRELCMMYLEIAAGASDVPATRFLAQSPGGLNATGDSDLENYYKSVGNIQKNDITPAMHILDECIIRDALGERPKEIYYTWRPLWTMSDTQKTQNFLIKTQGVVNLVNSGIYTPEELKPSVTNMLAEDGCLPGIEQEPETDEEIDENDDQVKAQFDGRKK
jgi:phage-related protein (TIGR01555 family)